MEIPRIAVIYRLDVAGHYYVGSTVKDFPSRIRLHKETYEAGDGRRLYAFIRDNGGWEAVTLTILDHWVVTGSGKIAEVATREQTHISLEDALCLNTIRAQALPRAEHDAARREEINAVRRERYRARKEDPVAYAAWLEGHKRRVATHKARKSATPEEE